MSPADARAALLLAECRRDWEAVHIHLTRARGANPADGPAQAALVALSLDHAYQAFETILLRIERSLGLPARAGSGWHATLLTNAALVIPGLRPPVFPAEATADWDALLRFRHFLRHPYVIDLEADKLAINAGRLERAVSLTDDWLTAVLAALVPNEG
jgi:hypothetical protein